VNNLMREHFMDLTRILAELREERDAVVTVITDMERLEYERQRILDHPLSLVAKRPANGTGRGDGLPNPLPGKDESK